MYQRILYTSRAGQDVGLRDVYDIIRTSHNRNSRNGLTGGLLFIHGYFLQVLEGAPYAIEESYKRILVDPRHHHVVLRLDESCTSLIFPSEWMALRSGNELDPEILTRHHYQPGMPQDRFSGREVLDFLVDCLVPAAAAA